MTLPNGLDALSYDVHTNRELELMLEGGKPLAHFSDAYPAEPDEEIFPEQAFFRYVESGRFVKREFVEPLRQPPPKDLPHVRGIRHLFYACASEEWRIDAYIMMMAAAAKAGWNEGFERLQGSLLGYEEWQTDIHMERLRASPHAKNFHWVRRSSR
jgi:hypothetical protein